MSRYIDVDKLVTWCIETYQMQSTVAGKAYVNALLTGVDSCPTADVVEVVRCKDCVYWKDTSIDTITDWHWGECCKPLGDYRDCETAENDFCSYGERREENEG